MGKSHEKLLNNLEGLRKAAGLTQQELSESAEVSRKSINAICILQRCALRKEYINSLQHGRDRASQ